MMTNPSKAKGSGYEREIVQLHKSLGIEATKTPLSGMLGGAYRGDVQVAGLIAECKRRRKGFSSLYKALDQDNADLLFVRDDNKETLIVLRKETYECFLRWLDWSQKYPINNTNDTNLGE